jgi:hypothetical protein
LTFEQDQWLPSGLVDGHDHDRSAVVDDVAAGANAARFEHFVSGDVENGTAVGKF